MTAVEQTTKYATTVDTLGEAWAFVMGRIDEVGDAPSVTISPVWRYRDGETRHFEVAVSGMREVAG